MSDKVTTASVILPTYNERESLPKLVEQLTALVPEAEIIVVDDASPDKTAAIARQLTSKHRVRVIERAGKLGLASAILDGFRAAHGDILLVMDADLSHDVAAVPDLIRAIQNGADVAVGSRFAPGGGIIGWPIHRQLMSAFATRVAKILLRADTSDPMSGFFALKRKVYERVSPLLRPRGYKLLLEILVRGAPLRVREVGFVFQDRQYGKSKLSWKIAREYLSMVLSLIVRRQR